MINVSAYQLMNASFVDQLVSLAEEYLVPLDRILIEVTESVFLNNTEAAVTVMKSLREMGIKFVLDDFGTGYSSLAYLQKLPIEYLKIDKSFIGSMMTSQDNLAIVNNILALGKSLQLEVIAEGVETQEQFDQLLLHGCAFFQGWYFGSPSKNL
jgi:EAL domain-containing protein (putative c-di-GMP-specific phosphodiesterase class I)